MSRKTVADKTKEYNKDNPEELKIPINEQESFYENIDNTVNISIDDVSIKKQKPKRPKGKRKKTRFQNALR